MKIIFDYNRTIFDPDSNTLYPGTRDVLHQLSSTCELFLVSMNDPERRSAIEAFNIERYFKKVFFVNKKSRSLFQKIAGVDIHTTIVVVGDSIRNEISIGNRLGYATVRFKRGKFAGQVPEYEDEYANFEITELHELYDLIRRISDQKKLNS